MHRPDATLMQEVIRLFQDSPDVEGLTATEVVKLLEGRGLYRFKGREHASAVQRVEACLADRMVFRMLDRGRVTLQQSFRY